MTPLERITQRVNTNGPINDVSTPRPRLTLEDFFDGNDFEGSICCNCTPVPNPSEVLATLLAIRQLPQVHDVLVEVYDQELPDEWPFAEVVWVVTKKHSADFLKAQFPKSFAPDGISFQDINDGTVEHVPVPPEMNSISCWWD